MSKAKGTRAEHKSIRYLERMGYRVTRAAASLGAWDLIGIRLDSIVLVQVKCNRWAGTKEREAMAEFPAPENAFKLQHRWDDRARGPRVACLFDGEWVTQGP